jgi:hypothetical protein
MAFLLVLPQNIYERYPKNEKPWATLACSIRETDRYVIYFHGNRSFVLLETAKCTFKYKEAEGLAVTLLV